MDLSSAFRFVPIYPSEVAEVQDSRSICRPFLIIDSLRHHVRHKLSAAVPHNTTLTYQKGVDLSCSFGSKYPTLDYGHLHFTRLLISLTFRQTHALITLSCIIECNQLSVANTLLKKETSQKQSILVFRIIKGAEYYIKTI